MLKARLEAGILKLLLLKSKPEASHACMTKQVCMRLCDKKGHAPSASAVVVWWRGNREAARQLGVKTRAVAAVKRA